MADTHFAARAASLREGDVIAVVGAQVRVHHVDSDEPGSERVIVFAYDSGGDGVVLLFWRDETVSVVRFAPATDAEFQGL